jgi:hypothetical protein
MAFLKTGDAEIIKIIKNSQPNDFETEQAFSVMKRETKNLEEDGNKTEFNKELE